MTTIPKHQRWQLAKALLLEQLHIPGILNIIREYHDGIEGYRVELSDTLPIPVICALPNGLLACVCASGLIGIYRNRELLMTLGALGSPDDTFEPIRGLAGLPNGTIASATHRITRVWDAVRVDAVRVDAEVDSNKCIKELAIQDAEKLVALSDGKLAVSCVRSVSVWDLDTGAPVYTVNLCGNITHLVALPDARLAISYWVYDTFSWHHHVGVWCEGRIIKKIVNPRYIIMLTEFNGKLAVGCVGGFVHVWDESFERSSKFSCADALWCDYTMCLSPNGLVASYVAGTLRIWDLYTGKLVQTLPGVEQTYESMWHADYLLASTSDGVLMWF